MEGWGGLGGRFIYSNTHPYSVLHYFKKEPKMDLEVWPTQIVFDFCAITDKTIYRSLTITADWKQTTLSSLAQYNTLTMRHQCHLFSPTWSFLRGHVCLFSCSVSFTFTYHSLSLSLSLDIPGFLQFPQYGKVSLSSQTVARTSLIPSLLMTHMPGLFWTVFFIVHRPEQQFISPHFL